MGTVYDLDIVDGPTKSELVRAFSVHKGSRRLSVEFKVRSRTRDKAKPRSYAIEVLTEGLKRRLGSDTDLTLWLILRDTPKSWHKEPKPYPGKAMWGTYDASKHTGLLKFEKS